MKAFIVLLLVSELAARVPLADAQAYKPGPVFYTSTRHAFAIQYDASIPDKEIQIGNAILNRYVPELFKAFWEPTADRVLRVHQDSTPCNGAGACADGTDLWIGYNPWIPESASIWVHELAHTLQFSGPVFALRQDVGLFYVEPTAGAISFILAPEYSEVSSDYASWIPDWGVAEAIYSYEESRGGRSHFHGSIWVGLYRADRDVFRNINARLSQLAEEGLSIGDVASFRELIRESVSVNVLDGLPIRQWLAVEGMLARTEVGNRPITHFDLLWYNEWGFGGGPTVYFSLEAVAIDRTIRLNASRTIATVYDAITRARIPQVTYKLADGGRMDIETNLDRSPPAVRVDLHIVGDDFVDDRSILLPLFPSSPRDFVLVSTPDQWIEPVSTTANVAGTEQEVSNGILAFDSDAPMVDIAFAGVPGSYVENFLPGRGFGMAHKVMVIGADHAALQLMTDSTMPTYWETGVPSAASITTNSTVYSFQLDSMRRLLNFTLGGPSGPIGYVSIMFRTDLIDGAPIVLIDGGSVPALTARITSNSSYHTVSFTYPHGDHTILIAGSNTILTTGTQLSTVVWSTTSTSSALTSVATAVSTYETETTATQTAEFESTFLLVVALMIAILLMIRHRKDEVSPRTIPKRPRLGK